MRLLFLGDVVGRAGRDAVSERLPGLIADYKFDFVVVNGENASHGRGLTEGHYGELRAAGADAPLVVAMHVRRVAGIAHADVDEQ